MDKLATNYSWLLHHWGDEPLLKYLRIPPEGRLIRVSLPPNLYLWKIAQISDLATLDLLGGKGSNNESHRDEFEYNFPEGVHIDPAKPIEVLDDWTCNNWLTFKISPYTTSTSKDQKTELIQQFSFVYVLWQLSVAYKEVFEGEEGGCLNEGKYSDLTFESVEFHEIGNRMIVYLNEDEDLS